MERNRCGEPIGRIPWSRLNLLIQKERLCMLQRNRGMKYTQRAYYPDGTIRKEGKLVNGECEGSWKKYNPLGLLIEDYFYDDGLLSGPQKTYFANGTIKEEYSCDSNNIVGIYKKYRINGHPERIGKYNKEGRNGEWLTYYSNDTIESRSFFLNGIQVGRQINFSPDGRIKNEEFFNNDGEDIRSIAYNRSEQIIADVDHEWGSVTFEIKFPDGKPKARISYCDNHFDGPQFIYSPNGKIISKIIFPVRKKRFNVHI